MTPIAKHSPEQKANADALIKEAIAQGITNPHSIAAMLLVVGKETDFKYKFEGSYRTTPNARIRKIFSDRVAMYNESKLTALKQNDPAFFEAIYGYKTAIGKKYGNTLPGDGYKFRGGGPNQLTFKGAYERIGKQIGVDLVKYPHLVNDSKVAAKITVQYFKNAFASASKTTLAKYNSTGINDFKNIKDSSGAFYHANAGFGKSFEAIAADPTGGLKKVRDNAESFSSWLSQNKGTVAAGGGLFFLIAVTATVLAIRSNKKKNGKAEK